MANFQLLSVFLPHSFSLRFLSPKLKLSNTFIFLKTWVDIFKDFVDILFNLIEGFFS